MADRVKEIMVTIGRNKEIVDMLDVTLTSPEDRAYIVCSFDDCRNNVKGQCTIHTVKSTRELSSDGHCRDYAV